MAIPFNIPNGGQPSQQQQQPTAQSPPTGNPANSETQQANQPDLPQFDSFDSEVLIQAFYEAICRCAQESQMSPPMSPSSPTNHSHFPFNWLEQSPSTSTDTTPRQSFRRTSRSRHSQGSYAQYSEVDDEDEEDAVRLENTLPYEQFTASPAPQPPKQNKKPKKESKITSFVIGALQYVIDTLKHTQDGASQPKK